MSSNKIEIMERNEGVIDFGTKRIVLNVEYSIGDIVYHLITGDPMMVLGYSVKVSELQYLCNNGYDYYGVELTGEKPIEF